MSQPNGRAPATGTTRNVRIAANGSTNGPKVDPNDPQVRKLVYNMYRGMLDKKHEKANVILDAAPQDHVSTDPGVGSRVQSMMRQQNELKGGNMNAGGPPPPPPPPPIPGISSSTRLPAEIPVRPQAMNPPAALAGAMMKEKKPFTYTPGGLDLSEINAFPRFIQKKMSDSITSRKQPSAQQNGGAMSETNGGDGAPVQSRSFRVLQNVLDHDTADAQGPVHIPHVKPQPMMQQIQQPQLYQQADGLNNSAPSDQTVPEPKKYMGGNIPSRSFRMLQAMTDADDVLGPGQSDL